MNIDNDSNLNLHDKCRAGFATAYGSVLRYNKCAAMFVIAKQYAHACNHLPVTCSIVHQTIS